MIDISLHNYLKILMTALRYYTISPNSWKVLLPPDNGTDDIFAWCKMLSIHQMLFMDSLQVLIIKVV